MHDSTCYYSSYMRKAHPKMIEIQSWAYPQYRRSFSHSVDEMNEIFKDGNAQRYMSSFPIVVSKFLDPNNAQYINPPSELFQAIEEVTKVNTDFAEEQRLKLRRERWALLQQKRMAKQKSTSTLPSTRQVGARRTSSVADNKNLLKKKQKQKSESVIGGGGAVGRDRPNMVEAQQQTTTHSSEEQTRSTVTQQKTTRKVPYWKKRMMTCNLDDLEQNTNAAIAA